MQQTRENTGQLMESMEAVPSQVYWGLAVGSIVLSAFLYLTGRRHAALFVGQWPPTLLIMGLFYKMLRPSREAGREQLGRAVRETGEAVR